VFDWSSFRIVFFLKAQDVDDLASNHTRVEALARSILKAAGQGNSEKQYEETVFKGSDLHVLPIYCKGCLATGHPWREVRFPNGSKFYKCMKSEGHHKPIKYENYMASIVHVQQHVPISA